MHYQCLCKSSIVLFVARYARVVTTRLSCLERVRADSLKAVVRLCSLLIEVPLPKSCKVAAVRNNKRKKLKYKANHFLNFQQREGDVSHDHSSFVLWTVFFLFFSFFFFLNDGITGTGENCASLHVLVSKNRDNFQVS